MLKHVAFIQLNKLSAYALKHILYIEVNLTCKFVVVFQFDKSTDNSNSNEAELSQKFSEKCFYVKEHHENCPWSFNEKMTKHELCIHKPIDEHKS